MEVAEYVEALRREGDLTARTLEAVSDWEAPVPTCPGWTVRELAHHLGRVHRWAALIVGERRADPPDEETEGERIWGTMPADDDLSGWYRDANATLVETLRRAPADLVCWSFLPAPSPLAFWARRQAHETAIHRADAQAVTGDPDGVDPAFAVDGIDELLLAFYGRPRNRVTTDEPRTLAITAGDADTSWIIHFGPDGAHPRRGAQAGADCEVRGSASDLYLALWNRRPLEPLRTAGDPALVDLWRTRANVRWS
jgi:uncharacterized protein (TIGR03083 family)